MQYQIVDEPKARALNMLIVDPLVIFFAAIFIPLIWTPPFFGRIWIPLVWLILNGFLLGSPSWIKEIAIACIGFALWWGFIYCVAYIMLYLGYSDYISVVAPYLRILNQGIFFLTLYLLVFIQRTPYEIYSYIKEQRAQ